MKNKYKRLLGKFAGYYWNPGDTAPKDRTLILAIFDGCPYVVYWNKPKEGRITGIECWMINGYGMPVLDKKEPECWANINLGSEDFMKVDQQGVKE